ncbi:MAG: glycosyltransferase family 39 protein [Flavobacteriales bacterium]|nr:glycosyltransferase family 39 protein [Flavobacteriales bacterium]
MARIPMWVFVAGSFLVLALASAWLARLSFASVRTYLDNVAPDGEVETYDGRFHGRVVRDLGRLAWLFAGLSVLSFAVRRSLSGAKGAQVKAMPEFRSGIRNTWYSLFHRSSSTHLRFVLGLIVLGSILRILQLSAPITYDEAFTYVQYASRPFHILLADYSYPNNHILHSLLVKLCTKLFGLHLWSLRLPALIAGILVMPVFYVFVRVMFNRYIALIALGLVASSVL